MTEDTTSLTGKSGFPSTRGNRTPSGASSHDRRAAPLAGGPPLRRRLSPGRRSRRPTPTIALVAASARHPVEGIGRPGFGPGVRLSGSRLYSPAMQYAETVLDLVGNTPLVRITRVTRDLGLQDRQPLLLAKMEMLNPGGSVKDRIGLPMIEAAEREGLLSRAGRSSSRPAATPATGWRSRRHSRAIAASS